MKILPEMFKYVCSTAEIHPRFLDIVFGFCRKTSSYGENSISYFNTLSCIAADSSRQPPRGTCDLCNAQRFSWILTSAEICYNLRYFEPHGRQLADPWSCRQSAIHQKLYLSNQHSAWTIIHTPLTFNDALRGSAEYIRSHPIGLHILYIRSCMHYWKEYLGFLGSQFRDIVCGGQRV
jgi:hypothetical protein